MKVAFLTLGCKVNSYETEKMKLQFEEAGHHIVSFSELADVYVVNTCTVTNIADRKSRKMLHRARRLNPDAVVVAAGCYVDSARQKGERDESVDVFLSNQEKENMVALMEKVVQEKEKKLLQKHEKMESPQGADREKRKENAFVEDAEGTMTNKSLAAAGEEHTRAYLKVQNGCNQYCTYCIIPYVRGELSSRSDEDILQEVQRRAAKGYHELVVTGIHLSSFGADRTGDKPDANSFLKLRGKPLLTLLQEISKVDGIERIRLGSLEPRIITEEFASELAKIRKICPHFHLSLQSGCDATLKRMNRHYSSREYLEKLEILRKYFIHPAITTDIIVGFPEESGEEFDATCAFAREAGFAQIHVFKYSRRQGTVADGMEGQIPEPVKSARSDVLLKIEKELEQKYQEYFLDRKEFILFEEISEIQGRKYLTGYNERYIRVAMPAEGIENAGKYCNTIIPVHISGHLTEEILLADKQEKQSP